MIPFLLSLQMVVSAMAAPTSLCEFGILRITEARSASVASAVNRGAHRDPHGERHQRHRTAIPHEAALRAHGPPNPLLLKAERASTGLVPLGGALPVQLQLEH